MATGTRQSSLTLVRHDKHQCRRALDGLADVGNRDHVLREFHAGEILLVLVFGIDDLGELLAFELGWNRSASASVGHRLWLLAEDEAAGYGGREGQVHKSWILWPLATEGTAVDGNRNTSEDCSQCGHRWR